MKEVNLPSGAKLQITPASFSVSKALFQSVLEDLKNLKLDPTTEIDVNLYKDMLCVGFSSKKIEACLKECMKKALYNGLHITDDLFEEENARQDYMVMCFEVLMENILPFTKALTQQLSAAPERIKKSLA